MLQIQPDDDNATNESDISVIGHLYPIHYCKMVIEDLDLSSLENCTKCVFVANNDTIIPYPPVQASNQSYEFPHLNSSNLSNIPTIDDVLLGESNDGKTKHIVLRCSITYHII